MDSNLYLLRFISIGLYGIETRFTLVRKIIGNVSQSDFTELKPKTAAFITPKADYLNRTLRNWNLLLFQAKKRTKPYLNRTLRNWNGLTLQILFCLIQISIGLYGIETNYLHGLPICRYLSQSDFTELKRAIRKIWRPDPENLNRTLRNWNFI